MKILQKKTEKISFKSRQLLIFLSVLICPALNEAARSQAGNTSVPKPKQVIIFKMDDLRARSQYAFQRVADICSDYGCKAGFGLIARSVEGDTVKESYINRIKNFENSGRIEIWHHGYDHFMSLDTVTEFRKMPYQHQYDHYKKALELVYERCGIKMRTFGSPGNRNDANTLLVMSQFPQIEVFLFPYYNDSTNKKFTLTHRVNMEKGTGIMDYNYFVNNYHSKADWEYMILQGHPGIWKEQDYKAFIDVIEFLKSKDVVFMNAYEYYKFLNP